MMACVTFREMEELMARIAELENQLQTARAETLSATLRCTDLARGAKDATSNYADILVRLIDSLYRKRCRCALMGGVGALS